MSLPVSFKDITRKIAIILVCGCLVLTTACSPLDKIISIFKDDGSGYVFKISIDSDPKTLDPQLASDSASVAIARNMFVGLLKTLPDGSLAPAAAKGYTIQRLFDPLTDSPYAKDYFCIKNSQKVNSGELEPYDIGVRAIDDETLEITLEYPNAAFLSLLTRLPASPCNQEFFESCGGKYKCARDFAVWMRFEKFPVLEGRTVIFGHTPTHHFQSDDPMAVWDAPGWIGIDCGCMLPETGDPRSGLRGRLACLRLDDMRVFYSEEPQYGDPEEAENQRIGCAQKHT